jgi:hypothetical protein
MRLGRRTVPFFSRPTLDESSPESLDSRRGWTFLATSTSGLISCKEMMNHPVYTETIVQCLTMIATTSGGLIPYPGLGTQVPRKCEESL